MTPVATPDGNGVQTLTDSGLPRATCSNCGWYIVKKGTRRWVHYSDDQRECSE